MTDPRKLWTDREAGARFADPGDCATRATRFERTIRRRNAFEYAAGVVVVLGFGWAAVEAFRLGETLIGVALGSLALVVPAVLWVLHRRGANLPRRPESSCREHLRAQLVRQYRLLRSAPLWYVGPLVPGSLLLYYAIGSRVAEKAGWSAALSGMAAPAAVTFGLYALIAAGNWFGAKGLKRQIDQLDAG